MKFDTIYLSLEFQCLARNFTYSEYTNVANIQNIPPLFMITEEEWEGLKVLFKIQ